MSAVDITRPGGRILFSSYAEQFWEDRLEWFRTQAAYGLIGEIDETATGQGVIVGKDGFTVDTLNVDDFTVLTEGLGRYRNIEVVAGSSLFCEITV